MNLHKSRVLFLLEFLSKLHSMKQTLRNIIMLIIAASLLSVTSCSKNREKSADTNTEDSKIEIMASFYPLYIMLLNITQDVEGVEVSMLAPADTGCLHDYQLTTRDMKKLEKCSILVVNGAGMEDFLDKALEIKKDSTIIASEGFPLFEENAHIWVSPKGTVFEIQNITDGLCRLDSNNAESYRKNAESYIQKITALSEYMHSELDGFAGTKIITFHEAFPYFASEFNLELSAVIERDAGTEPSPKELKELISLIKDVKAQGGNLALFAEPQYSSSAASVISSETGLTVAELDPSVTGTPDKDSYINAMKENTKILKEMLSVK